MTINPTYFDTRKPTWQSIRSNFQIPLCLSYIQMHCRVMLCFESFTGELCMHRDFIEMLNSIQAKWYYLFANKNVFMHPCCLVKSILVCFVMDVDQNCKIET